MKYIKNKIFIVSLTLALSVCIIFSVFTANPPAVDASASATTMVWSYLGELIFNLLVLTGTIKMADRVVREMFGL